MYNHLAHKHKILVKILKQKKKEYKNLRKKVAAFNHTLKGSLG